MAGHYRGTCKCDDPPCYLFIRFGTSRTQSCKNSLWKQNSIHNNYTGNVVGIASEVENIEEGTCSDKGMVILRFECQGEAERWEHSAPEIKQSDWLDGVDMITVTAKKPIDLSKPWLEMMELDFVDYNRFLHDYVVKANPYLDKVGGSFGVVTSDKPKQLRGLWDPSHVIVNQFDCKEQFTGAYHSEEYKPLKQLRDSTCRAKISLFKLKSLMEK